MTDDSTTFREPGEIINGRYRIDRFIGSGAMGGVYDACDTQTDSHVALKFLYWRSGSRSVLEHFKSEFALLTSLHHPNITSVYDLEQDRETEHYFFSSELVNGTDCFAASEREPWTTTIQWMRDLLCALQYLHDHHVYHFDIKPQNVLITTDTHAVKLIDFGLSSLGMRNQLVGTPSYMAPEIIARSHTDHRADLYSLGVVLLMCLTRQNPFRAASREETFERHKALTPPLAHALRPDIPPGVSAVIAKLLAKHPDARFADARAVYFALEPWDPTHARRLTEKKSRPWECGWLAEDSVRLAIERWITSRAGGDARTPLLLVIRGAKGIGKTRSLRETKFAAQLRGLVTDSCDAQSVHAVRKIAERLRRLVATSTEPRCVLIDNVSCGGDPAASLVSPIAVHVTELIARTRLAPVRSAIVLTTNDRTETITASCAAHGLTAEQVMIVSLAPLCEKYFCQFVSEVTDVAQLGALWGPALYQYTQGNPQFGLTILQTLFAQTPALPLDAALPPLNTLTLPHSLDDALRDDIAQLDDLAKKIASVATWIDRPATRAEFEAVLGELPEVAVITTLVQKGLLSFDPLLREYTCRNYVMARACAAALPEIAQRGLHDRIVTWLERTPRTKLSQYYWHVARGTQEMRGDAVLWRTISHHIAHHQWTAALRAIAALRGVAPWAADSDLHLELALLQSALYRDLGNFSESRRVCEEIQLQCAADERHRLRMRDLYESLAHAALCEQDYLAAAASLHLAHAMVDDTEEAVDNIRIANARAHVELCAGQLDTACAHFSESETRLRELPRHDSVRIQNFALAECLRRLGKLPEASAALEREFERIRHFDVPRYHHRLQCTRALIAHDRGAHDDARVLLLPTLEAAQILRDTDLEIEAWCALAGVYHSSGAVANAYGAWSNAIALRRVSPHHTPLAWMFAQRAACGSAQTAAALPRTPDSHAQPPTATTEVGIMHDALFALAHAWNAPHTSAMLRDAQHNAHHVLANLYAEKNSTLAAYHRTAWNADCKSTATCPPSPPTMVPEKN